MDIELYGDANLSGTQNGSTCHHENPHAAILSIKSVAPLPKSPQPYLPGNDET